MLWGRYDIGGRALQVLRCGSSFARLRLEIGSPQREF